MAEQIEAPKHKPIAPVFNSGWLGKFSNPALVCLLLASVTFLVYSPVAYHDFVNYDDSDYVTSNPHVQGGLSLANIKWAFTTGHASNWHPLTWLSHIVDYQLFHAHAGAHHLVSLGFHIANSLLLFVVLQRMTGAHWRSAFVAGLFALHPMHVESVAWVSERKDVLSAFFFFLTLLTYDAFVRRKEPAVISEEGKTGSSPMQGKQRGSTTNRKSTNPQNQGISEVVAREYTFGINPSASTLYFLTLVVFALGLLSKPMLVTLPFVLLLLDFWPLRRIAPDGAEPIHISALMPLCLEKIPFFILSAGSCVATYFAQKNGGAVSTSISLGARMANAVVSYTRYLGKLFWPKELSVLYPHPGYWPAWDVAAAAVLLFLLCAATIWFSRRYLYLAVGWLWFLGMLVPVIGLIQVGIQSMADRYTYLPAIGIFLIIAWGLADLFLPRPGGAGALAYAALLSLTICSVLTFRQVGYWHDSEKLFRRAVEVTPNNYLAYNNLGFYLSNHGRSAEAMENYKKSLDIKPDYEDALNNVGYALAGQKRFLEAIPYYEKALRIRPDHVEVHNNLGNALSEIGRIPEAIQHYNFVLGKNPDHADAHNNLGIALAMQGKLDEAVPHFAQAIRLRPAYASAHSNLGNALAVQHKLPEAIQEYEMSLRLNPKDPQAHNNLGNVLSEQGKLTEAVKQYALSLSQNADNPETHFNAAVAYARLGNREESLKHCQEALRLKPDYADARRQLDALLAAPKPAP